MDTVKIVVLWSDLLIYLLAASLTLFFWNMRGNPITAARWRQVFGTRLGMATFVVLGAYIMIALLDSLHFRLALDFFFGYPFYCNFCDAAIALPLASQEYLRKCPGS